MRWLLEKLEAVQEVPNKNQAVKKTALSMFKKTRLSRRLNRSRKIRVRYKPA